MDDVRDAFLVWSVAELVGVLGLPAAGFLFTRLPGAGLALARPLALLVLAYPVWLLASLGLVPYGRASVLLGVAALAALSAWALRRTRPLLTRGGLPLRLWLAGELIFSIAFFGWAALRAFTPEVLETEKPMDMAFVNAVNRSEWFPPHDPWLAGADLNYYYYGHYLVALLVRTTGVEPAVGYNLALALFYALVASALFAVAAALSLAARRAAPRLRAALLPGLAAVLFGVVLGNLAGAVELLERPGSVGAYDWFAPSRVIEGTANEFPLFSFLLGDLHAHVLATPFALVAVAFALQVALAGPRLPAPWLPAGVELLLGALVLGSLYAVNTLDFPTALLVVLAAVVVWIAGPGRRNRRWAVSLWALALPVAALALFAPFVAAFSPHTDGVALVTEHEPFTELMWELLLIYALPAWVLVAAFCERLGRPRRELAWASVLVLVVLVLLAPDRVAGLALLLGAVAVALHAAFDTRLGQGRRFFWILVAVGVGLVAIGDFAYIRDAFDGTPSYRLNTVFKAGYQAWFLLAVAAAYAVFRDDWRLRRPVLLAWRAGLAALVLVLAVYPLLGSYSRTDGFSGERTLDGMRWLERRSPGDAEAIRWLRDEVDGAPTIVEAVGPDYSPAGHARVATFTGLPTVVGWGGHEVQWGHDPGRRPADVDSLFRTSDTTRARRLLARYGVQYVFVGSLERAAYPRASLAKFARLGRPVFSSGGTTVYAVGAADSGRTPAAAPERASNPPQRREVAGDRR